MFSWNIFKVLSNFRQLTFIWLKVILAIAVFLWIFWLVTFTIEVIFPVGLFVMYMYNILYLFIALIVLVFGYFAILKPYVPEAYIRASVEIAAVTTGHHIELTPIAEIVKADIPNIDSGVFKKYFILLEAYITSTKKFTNPDITLIEIANQLNTNSFNISKAIKIYSKEGSFYEYINRYRLIYFLGLLVSPENDQFTITALALKAGFTSTTTLNKYCKKITGTTPARAKVLLEQGKTVEDLLNG